MGRLLVHKNRVVGGQSQLGYPSNKLMPTFTRNTEWLTMPTLVDGDEKIHMLVEVYENSPNYINFSVNGAFTVNWGDGNIINYTAGTEVNYIIQWSGTSASTLTSYGYRQAMVTITPQSPSGLTSFNLQKIIRATPNNSMLSGILDIKMAAFNLSQLVLYSGPHKYEIFEFVGSHKLVSNVTIGYGLLYLFHILPKLKKVIAPQVLSGITNTEYMFNGCSSLVDVTLTSTSGVTKMNNMFNNCSSLTILPSNLNTSNLVDASNLFSNTGIIRFGTYNLSKVTNASNMFNGCINLEIVDTMNLPLAITTDFLFNGCIKLYQLPNINIPVSTTAAFIFNGCSNLIRLPNGITTSNSLLNVQQMFYQCTKLTEAPFFNTSKVTNFYYMLGFTILYSVPAYNISSGTNFQGMFYNCTNLSTVPTYNTSSGTNFQNMFYNCTNLSTIPAFNFSAAINMNSTFYGSGIREITLDTTINAQDMTTIFSNCFRLTKVNSIVTSAITSNRLQFSTCPLLSSIPTLNVSNFTSLANMFNACPNLTGLTLTNTSNVTSLNSTFKDCTNLKYLSISDTSKVTDWSWCFALSGFEVPPIINTSAATTTYTMFYTCPNLKSVGNLDLRKATDISFLFYGCPNLIEIEGLNVLSATTAISTFGNCSLLREIPTINMSNITSNSSMLTSNTMLGKSGIFGLRFAHTYNSANLTQAAIVNIFNNLGTASGTQNINVALNPGSTSLTASDRLIATNKGWTVTY